MVGGCRVHPPKPQSGAADELAGYQEPLEQSRRGGLALVADSHAPFLRSPIKLVAHHAAA
jgi:hypothetical protein